MNPCIEAGARAYEQLPSPCELHEKVQVSKGGSYAMAVSSCSDCNKNRLRAAAIAMVGALSDDDIDAVEGAAAKTFYNANDPERRVLYHNAFRAELTSQLTEV